MVGKVRLKHGIAEVLGVAVELGSLPAYLQHHGFFSLLLRFQRIGDATYVVLHQQLHTADGIGRRLRAVEYHELRMNAGGEEARQCKSEKFISHHRNVLEG